MKTYTKPQIQIVDTLPAEYCAVGLVISDTVVTDRVTISVEDVLDD